MRKPDQAALRRLFELRVDHAAVLLLPAVCARRAVGSTVRAVARSTRCSARRAGLLVHHARDAVRFLLEPLAHALHGVVVLLLDRLPPFADERLDAGHVADLVLALGD